MTRVAKGKKLFQTNLPAGLVQELEWCSNKTGIPRTVLIEIAVKDVLKKMKESGLLDDV